MGDACSKNTQLGISQFRHQPRSLVSWWLQNVRTAHLHERFPILQIICARKALATAGRTSPALTDPVDDRNQAKSTSTVRIRVLCVPQGQNSEQLP